MPVMTCRVGSIYNNNLVPTAANELIYGCTVLSYPLVGRRLRAGKVLQPHHRHASSLISRRSLVSQERRFLGAVEVCQSDLVLCVLQVCFRLQRARLFPAFSHQKQVDAALIAWLGLIVGRNFPLPPSTRDDYSQSRIPS